MGTAYGETTRSNSFLLTFQNKFRQIAVAHLTPNLTYKNQPVEKKALVARKVGFLLFIGDC